MSAVVEARTGRILAWADGIPLSYEYTAGTAGEAFLTSSVRGMLPIARLLNSDLPSPGPVTRQLWNDILPWLESGGTTP